MMQIRSRTRFKSITLVIVLLAPSCATHDKTTKDTATALTDSQPAPQIRNLNESGKLLKLPVVLGKRLQTISGDVGFEKSRWVRPANTTEGANNEPFANSNDAVAAARQFISTHFGLIKAPSEILVSPWSTSKFETINVRQKLFGLDLGRVHGRGWIEFEGKTPGRASLYLYEFLPLPDTYKTIITKEEAKTAWQDYAKRHGSTLEEVAIQKKLKLIEPILFYNSVLSPDVVVVNGIEYNSRFHPAWALDNNQMICVNAHTGNAWYEFEEKPDGTVVTSSPRSLGPKSVKTDVSERLGKLVERIEAVLAKKETIDLTGVDETKIPKQLEKRDKMVYKLVQDFERSLSKENVETMTQFALSEDGISSRWLVAQMLLNLEHYNSAAKVVLSYVIINPEERRYRTWKWMHVTFSARKDYQTISLQFTDALLHEFEIGDSDTKLAIADLFSRGADDAKLTLEEFKKAIQYDEALKKMKAAEK